ncbi:MAG: 3'-5' exonuclease [Bacteroidetes bacterium CG23_combo_of_CG06-09_8_20_14_all_32_9]|nr:MAG: 3'-5' exonuclease [Bacteroidetes bacterium CG23_combo_of_CG06-09_8_20_14_all_32_9]
MLEAIKNTNILFLDIETVPQFPVYSEVPEKLQKLWDEKSKNFREEKTSEDVYERAGIYAEFGKIICISVGAISEKPNRKIRLKSFFGDNEKQLLESFFQLLNSKFNRYEHFLCAHNGKEFDYPYIARRGLINGLKLPKILDNSGKKPWEIKHLDTLELWKFGDYKHYTSLNLLTAIFDIPSPKDDISGADVAKVYYIEKDLPRIVKYCEKDVLALAQLLLRYKSEMLIPEENVEHV